MVAATQTKKKKQRGKSWGYTCSRCPGSKFTSRSEYQRHWQRHHNKKGPQLPWTPPPGAVSDGEAADPTPPPAPKETVMSVLLELLDEAEVPVELRLKYSMRILRMIESE